MKSPVTKPYKVIPLGSNPPKIQPMPNEMPTYAVIKHNVKTMPVRNKPM